jgi:hypothetical protein
MSVVEINSTIVGDRYKIATDGVTDTWTFQGVGAFEVIYEVVFPAYEGAAATKTRYSGTYTIMNGRPMTLDGSTVTHVVYDSERTVVQGPVIDISSTVQALGYWRDTLGAATNKTTGGSRSLIFRGANGSASFLRDEATNQYTFQSPGTLTTTYQLMLEDEWGVPHLSSQLYTESFTVTNISTPDIGFAKILGIVTDDNPRDNIIDLNSGGSISMVPEFYDDYGRPTSDLQDTVSVNFVYSGGSAQYLQDGDSFRFTTPGDFWVVYNFVYSSTNKQNVVTQIPFEITSSTYNVQPVTVGMTIDSFFPILNDICTEDDNTLTITGSGFSTPLHVYIDGIEHSSQNISVSSGGDTIYDLIVPDLPVGPHTVVLFTDSGKMTSAIYSFYDSGLNCTSDLLEYRAAGLLLAGCEEPTQTPTPVPSEKPIVAPAAPSPAAPTPTITTDSGQILSIGDIAKLSEDRQYDIVRLAKLGITTGCNTVSESNKIKKIKYCPKNPVNRGAMAEFLKKTNNITNRVGTAISLDEDFFSDIGKVTVNRRLSILWLAQYKITLGKGTNAKGDTTYRPQDSVTRGAMAEFLFKLAGSPPKYKDYSPNFSDIKNLTPERIRAINWMGSTGITKGSGSAKTYKPSDIVTRGAMAQFIMRFIDYLEGKERR